MKICWVFVYCITLNLTIQFHRVSRGSYGNLSLRKPSPSWELPNAGNGRGPAWSSQSVEPARH